LFFVPESLCWSKAYESQGGKICARREDLCKFVQHR
jgi:hypothetical protein